MKFNLQNIFGKIRHIVSQYPLVLGLSLVASLCIIYNIEAESTYYKPSIDARKEDIEDLKYIIYRLIYVFLLGISVLFSMSILSQRIGKKWMLNLIGILAILPIYFIFPEKENDFRTVHTIVLVAFPILSHLLVSFIPFLKAKNSQGNFWEYNQNLFINLVLTFIFSFVLIGGVELALLSVENLFNLKFNNIYVNSFAFLGVFGSTSIFLLFNAEGLSSLEAKGKYPVILKFFTQFILIPLLILYAIILYMYAGKILIQCSLPRGWVSFMVIAYCVVGVFALLLVYPLKNNNTKSWVKVFSKIFYFSTIPFIVLLFTAIFTRILEYGYTENRYFVVLIAIWITCIVLYFTFYKKASIKFIPISLFIFGVFALLFPFLNAFSVAKTSQKNQLENILIQNQLLKNGKIIFNKPISDSIVTLIGEKFEFLHERKQEVFLMQFLSKDQLKTSDFSKWNMWSAKREVKTLFTNVIRNQSKDNYNYWRIVSDNNIHHVKDFDYVLFNNYNSDTKKLGNKSVSLHFNQKNKSDIVSVFISDENTKKEYDLAPFIQKTIREHESSSELVTIPYISHEFELDEYYCKIYFESINIYNKVSSEYRFNVNQGVLLLKHK